MPKIFVSTACLRGTASLDDRISLYRAAGMHAIELGFGIDPGSQPVTRDRLGPDISALIHNYFPPPVEPFVLNLASANERIAKASLRLVREALDLSRELGAPAYSVHAGFVTDPTEFRNGTFVMPHASADERVAATERFTSAIRTAANLATVAGVELLVENNVSLPEDGETLLLRSSSEIVDFVQSLGDGRVGILLDTGHLNVSSTTLGLDAKSEFDRIAPYVRALHIHDNDGLCDQHRPAATDGWIVARIREHGLNDLPIIVEAKFNDVGSLRAYVESLYNVLLN